ncbi:MAG TPA: AraC family transcriptional regulator [Anaeromyxobacteraceae bacterium]|nr:AraC family transcriptional regulator [Anaeromyxobacteraceae bacterium]
MDRIDLRTGRRRNLFRTSFTRSLAGEACRGVQVVAGRALPGELAEGILTHHLLAVNLGGPVVYEIRWPGRAWRAAAASRHAIQLFPAGMPFAARWDQPVEVLTVGIAPSFVSAATGAEGALSHLELDPAAAVEAPVVAHAALALAEEVRAGAPGGPLCGESLATALVACLLSSRAEPRLQGRRRTTLSRHRLERVLDYISEHLASAISLRELADLVEMDVFGFVRAFKQSTGLPPHQYVLRTRVQRAKALLKEGRLSISDVALATGFATPSHFATTFRRLARATPRAYRDSVG